MFVTYRTEDVTARAGSDYQRRSSTLIFEPGEAGKTVSVPIIDGTVEDSGEHFVLRLTSAYGAHLSRAGGFGTIYNSEDILTGFTLVNAASGTVVGGVDDGGTVTLNNPANGPYGVRVDTVADTGVNSVRLELSGAKTVIRTDNEAPYTLYAEGGEGLPPGTYALQATAYPETDRGGNALQTISISFTVAASTQDEDEGTALPASPYASELTASFTRVPASHAGPGERFTFELAFSEAPKLSYKVLRDESLAATGGVVRKARRLERPSNQRWEISVEPSGWDDVRVTLAGGRACGTTGAICTGDGKVLSNTATVPGPLALAVTDARVEEGPEAVPATRCPPAALPTAAIGGRTAWRSVRSRGR